MTARTTPTLSPEHVLLRESLSDLLNDHSSTQEVERAYQDGGFSRSAWAAVAGGGWLEVGRLAGERTGLTSFDVTMLAAECGAHLLGGPFSIVVGVVVPLLDATDQRTAAESVVAGDELVTALLPRLTWTGATAAWRPQLAGAMHDDGTTVVSGSVRNVPFLDRAARLLAPVDCGSGVRLALLSRDRDGIEVSATSSVDGTRPTGDVTFTGARIGESEWLGDPGADHAELLDRSLWRYLALLDGEAVGGMGEILRRTVAYVCERRQFGVPIGSFQAIKHKLADAHVAVEVARVHAARTAWMLDEEPRERIDLLCSRVQVADAYVKVCETAIQCHGGYGFAWEQALHFWYRRALFDRAHPVPVRRLRRLIERSIKAAHAAGDGARWT